MPTYDTDDVVEVSVQAEYDNTEDIFNVYKFAIGTIGSTSEADFVTELKELVEVIVAATKVLSQGLTVYRRFRARFVTQVDAGRIVELDAPITGTAAGDPTPSGVAALLAFRTTVKKATLKKYIGSLSEGDVGTDGQLTAAALTHGADILAVLLAPIATTNVTWNYVHYDADLDTYYLPTGGYINSEPAYQRRRRRGSGS